MQQVNSSKTPPLSPGMVGLRVAGVKRNTSISTQISVDHRPLARCSLAAGEGPLVQFTGKRGESKVCKPWVWCGDTCPALRRITTNSRAIKGAGKKRKRSSWSESRRLWLLSFLHPTPSILNVCSTLSYNSLVGFLTENGQ